MNEKLNYRLHLLAVLAELQKAGHKCNSEIKEQLDEVKKEIESLDEGLVEDDGIYYNEEV